MIELAYGDIVFSVSTDFLLATTIILMAVVMVRGRIQS